MILSTTFLKKSDRSLSASSKTIMLQFSTFATSFEIRSRIRPGVAMIMWIGLSRRMMSARKSVPPVVTMTPSFLYFDRDTAMLEVWRASSRVGTRMIA